jgi:hypothetical protein
MQNLLIEEAVCVSKCSRGFGVYDRRFRESQTVENSTKNIREIVVLKGAGWTWEYTSLWQTINNQFYLDTGEFQNLDTNVSVRKVWTFAYQVYIQLCMLVEAKAWGKLKERSEYVGRYKNPW